MFKHYLLVFVGAGLGGVLRYVISNFIQWDGTSFPWGTFTINLLGCVLLGFVLGFVVKQEHFSYEYKLLLATGICGGFTTFSALSAEALQLIKQGQLSMAITYILASVLLGVVACFGGGWLGR
jgi:fluoride exporter